MTAKNQKIVFLTDDQKLEVLKDYENSGKQASAICRKWGIGVSTLYVIKKQWWETYQNNKETLLYHHGNVGVVNPQDGMLTTTKRMVSLQKDTSDTLAKILRVANMKLDRELKRLIETEYTDLIVGIDVLSGAEIASLYKILAPYVMSQIKEEPAESGNKTVTQQYNYVMNLIQNQKIKNGNETH